MSATPAPPAASDASQPQKNPPRIAIWIATGFGLGYAPIASGTWGSLGGVAVFYLSELCLLDARTYWNVNSSAGALPISLAGGIAITLLVALVGVWASRHGAWFFRKTDPGQVVVDEISGQHISYLPLAGAALAPGGWKYLLLGFILFRAFDIVKPWPARAAEKWPSGWGIMADDWFAGAYAALGLWIVKALNLL